MTTLLRKPITEGSIVSFRLITGETLIATFVRLTQDNLEVTRPVVANPIQDGASFGIYYSPFCATVDEQEQHVIPRSSLLVMPLAPREELKASYLKMMTGLDIPTTGMPNIGPLGA